MNYEAWKKIISPYSFAVEELKIKFRNIRKEYLDKGEHSPIEFVTGRTKNISSIMSKMKRLKVTNIEDDIEDIAGIRLMCQFVEDIYVIVDIIRQRTDMRVIMEKDYIQNAKESGYRSYHMIIMYPIHTIDGSKEIQCEIQIRTLAMNFWATIEHSLKYKFDHYIPDELSDRLQRAADAAFHLDQEMGAIREEIITAQVLFSEKESVASDVYTRIYKLREFGDLERYFRYRAKIDELSSGNDVAGLIELKKELDGILRTLSTQIVREEED